MIEITKKSNAKLNLFLEVKSKREDGFHNLSSLMSFCDFGDEINVSKSNNFDLKILGPFGKELDSSENIICLAIKKVQNLIKQKINVRIKLTKNLPVSSGMGGGSSNAATVIRCIDDLFNLKLKTKNINLLLLSIGADVPFCYYGKTALVEGVGEHLRFTGNIPEFYVLLVNPLIEVSTKEIFKKLDQNFFHNTDFSEEFLEKNKIINFLKSRKNILEEPAIQSCQVISNILSVLRNETNSLISRMTGSGATCYGLFNSLNDVSIAERKIKNFDRDLWVKKTKIINRI